MQMMEVKYLEEGSNREDEEADRVYTGGCLCS